MVLLIGRLEDALTLLHSENYYLRLGVASKSYFSDRPDGGLLMPR